MAPNNHRMMMINNDRSRTFNSDRQHWSIIKLFMVIIIIIIISMSTKTVDASGYFELQFIEGIRNSTTIHVCLKEFWNSQINLNRCTFGQKTIIYYEQQQSQQHSKQSMIRIPFSFRWIVSIRIFFCQVLFINFVTWQFIVKIIDFRIRKWKNDDDDDDDGEEKEFTPNSLNRWNFSHHHHQKMKNFFFSKSINYDLLFCCCCCLEEQKKYIPLSNVIFSHTGQTWHDLYTHTRARSTIIGPMMMMTFSPGKKK